MYESIWILFRKQSNREEIVRDIMYHAIVIIWIDITWDNNAIQLTILQDKMKYVTASTKFVTAIRIYRITLK